MEKKTGVHNGIIARSINSKEKIGNTGHNGNVFIFYEGNKQILKVPLKNTQKIKEKLRTNKKLTIEQKIENIERIGIEICSYKVDQDRNLKLVIKCMICGEHMDELNYDSILNSQYSICKECRKIINRKKQSSKKKYTRRLIDVRPEFFAQYGGQYMYDEKENNNIKLDEFSESSNKRIIIRCKDCGETRNLQVSDITAKDNNGNFVKDYNCIECYQETIKIKNAFPELINMVDIGLQSNRIKLSKELTRESILNMSVKSKEKLPIACFKCGKPHDVAIFQIAKQNRDGVKLCSECKTLMQTSFHHIYLLDYLLKTGDEIESEMVITVNNKYLRVDAVNHTKKKAYEVNGPQHKDKNNNLNVKATKRLGITTDELFEIITQNDKMKKDELEKMGYEVIVIDIENISIIDMLSEVSGESITELPKIDFSKYENLAKVNEVQNLINNNCDVREISNQLDISRRTVYNYINKGLVCIPSGSPIGNRMNKKLIADVQLLIDNCVEIKDIAEKLNINKNRIYKWIDNGTIKVDESSKVFIKNLLK